jgi:hypothetical protein
MKRMGIRVWVGIGLVLLGLLMLAERLGIFEGLMNLFWGLLFLAGGAYFLYRFANNMRGEWWAAIPGFALAGIAADSLLPRIFGDWGGLFFLASLGLGFFAVYLSGKERWWAIIPGGVLITLGLISAFSSIFGMQETGGVFFLGLGLTFLLVAVLASMQWAYIPAAVLLVMGALLGTPFTGLLNFLWPAVLIVGGLILVFQFFRRQ